MPKAVEDIPEAELRELVSWFRERGSERRRLLKRYRAGRLKTEALDAKKKVRGLFGSTWIDKLVKCTAD